MNILFVCTGNTCRSCMAEAIFNSLCEIEGISAFSAGVAIVHESITSENSALAVKNFLNIDISKRKAVQVTKALMEDMDLILTMTGNHKNILSFHFPELLERKKLYTLNEYIGEVGEVIDPYGGGYEIYQDTYSILEKKIKALLLKIKEDIQN